MNPAPPPASPPDADRGALAPGGSDPRPGASHWRLLRRLHADESGATSTEYMLIMIFVVLPIALLYPVFMKMVKLYGGRMTGLMGLPFP